MTILDSDAIWTALGHFVGTDEKLQDLTGEVANADDSGGEGHPNTDLAHEAAEDEMRSIIAQVATWPLDSWPLFLERVLCAVILDNVTATFERRPEWIATRRKQADDILDDLKTQKRAVFDTDTATDAGSRLAATSSQFRDEWDADDSLSALRLRRPSL